MKPIISLFFALMLILFVFAINSALALLIAFLYNTLGPLVDLKPITNTVAYLASTAITSLIIGGLAIHWRNRW